MACALYYEFSLAIFVFVIIGLLIGIVLGLIVWFIYAKCCITAKISTSDKQSEIDCGKIISTENNRNQFNMGNIDIRKLLKTNCHGNEKDEFSNHVGRIIYYNNFDFGKHMSYETNIDICDKLDFPSSDIVKLRKELKSYYELDLQYMNNRLTGHMYLIKQLINLLFVNKLINKEEYHWYCQRLADKYRVGIDDFNEDCQQFIGNIRKKIETSSPIDIKAIDVVELQVIEQLPSMAEYRINQMVYHKILETRDIIHNVQINKKLSQEDANRILNIYSQNVRSFENYLGNHKNKEQCWHEKRWTSLDSKFKNIIIEALVNHTAIEQRESTLNEEILAKIENLSQSDRNQIMNEYRTRVNEVKVKHEEEFRSHRLTVISSMKESRRKEIEKAFQFRNTELKEISEIAMKYTLDEYDEFLNKYRQIEDNINSDIHFVLNKMDKLEIDEFSQFKMNFNQSVNREINKVESELIQKICDKLLISPSSMKEIMNSHQKNLYQLQKSFDEDKSIQIDRMNKILNEMKELNSEEMTMAIEGQLSEEKKQIAVFNMTMNTQLILPFELKKMVLDDIRSYAVAVDNQLQSVAMRHQKLVELALANRRQELSNLIKVPTSANVQKSKIDLYADADKQLEQEKSIVFMKSRDKIVNETKSVLKQQEEHVAGMIAKHMIRHFQKIKKKNTFDRIYGHLFNEINKKLEKSFSAKQVIDQFLNEKNYIENQKQSTFQNQREQMDKVIHKRKDESQNERKLYLQKRYTDQLIELQKIGVGEDAVRFADRRFIDKIERSVEDTGNEVQQQLIVESEIWREQIEKSKFHKTLNNRLRETLSKLVDLSSMSKTELFDFVKRINPDINDGIKNQVVKEIYGKQNQTAIELPKYEPRKFDEKDIRKEPQTISKHFQESQQDYFDVVDNMSQGTKPKKRKTRIKRELPEETNEESDF